MFGVVWVLCFDCYLRFIWIMFYPFSSIWCVAHCLWVLLPWFPIHFFGGQKTKLSLWSSLLDLWIFGFCLKSCAFFPDLNLSFPIPTLCKDSPRIKVKYKLAVVPCPFSVLMSLVRVVTSVVIRVHYYYYYCCSCNCMVSSIIVLLLLLLFIVFIVIIILFVFTYFVIILFISRQLLDDLAGICFHVNIVICIIYADIWKYIYIYICVCLSVCLPWYDTDALKPLRLCLVRLLLCS